MFLISDRSNSPSEGSEGTGDDTIAILKKQRKRRSMKKGRSPGSSEGSRGAFSPQYSDDNFPGSPHGKFIYKANRKLLEKSSCFKFLKANRGFNKASKARGLLDSIA